MLPVTAEISFIRNALARSHPSFTDFVVVYIMSTMAIMTIPALLMYYT